MVKQLDQEYVIHKYPLQHYYTVFNRKTGFFARIEEKNHPEPTWSQEGPELLDISITNWCDKNCQICYKDSTTSGCHMSLSDYEEIMIQAEKMPVVQVALGGGNPNQHPYFTEILRLTRKKYNIVPSYTTNGRGLSQEVLNVSKECCGAVAVSAYEPYDEMYDAIMELEQNQIKTNIHFVLSRTSIETAIEWLTKTPPFLKGINAIIFLNYKPIGKHQDQNLLLANSKDVRKFFNLVANRNYDFKIGFDSCSVSGIVCYTQFDPTFFDHCDSGRFSMYISEDLNMYPCSFMIEGNTGVSMRDKNIIDAWQKDELFVKMRSEVLNDLCLSCQHSDICKGGCPIFPELNICTNYIKTLQGCSAG